MRIMILSSLLMLVGCSATMVKNVNAPSKFAPEGYQDTGVVEYLNKGWDVIIKQRRESAFKKMYQACDGRYKIIREGNKSAMMVENSWDAGYWMIEFQCTGKVAEK